MRKALIINGHQPYASSTGMLNAAFVERTESILQDHGCEVRTVKVSDAWAVATEIENQLWADILLFQFPLNSMSVPWSLKRYLDEVYTAGMDGRLAKGDGRTRSDPNKQYGSGGLLQDKTYSLSVTLNAPRSAFSDPAQNLFEGRSLDELLAPIHINFAFFGLQRLPTFAAYDVNKGAQIERDFECHEAYVIGLTSRFSKA